jgi:hypothetical protein
MPRSIALMGLAAAVLLAACSERTSPDPLPDQPNDTPAALPAGPAASNAARERLARRLALALADPHFRGRLKRELDRSPIRERKLHLQRFLTGADRLALRELARLGRDTDAAGETDLLGAIPLEVYLPVPAHRQSWPGDERILVATAKADGEAPVAYTTAGERLVLDPVLPPATPVLAVVPVETDFDRVEPAEHLLGGNSGGGSSPPAGLYMTYSHFVETFEGWLKGAPEFEVHMLGQAGASDSLQSYSCAGEQAGGYYRFNQDNLDWSGNVLLISQNQINSYKAVHPNQNMRLFVVEDDDTACQIKTDVNRFKAVVTAVESAYPTLTGGRDTTGSNLQRWWRRANALQRIIKAVAGFIVTNDELVGNGVETAVAGVFYPGANWVIKGENNKTNGWVNIIMR